jgi:hypothetical protein
MDSALNSVLSSMGAAAPFALLAVYMIRWLMAELKAERGRNDSLVQQVILLAQAQERPAAEQTAAIKGLGH